MEQKRIYILDFGHGGINPSSGNYVTAGKRSPKWDNQPQLFEGVNNREIGKRVSDKLNRKNIKHVFTVLADDWQDVPLNERIAIANAYQAEFDCFGISIHSNGSSSKHARGYEVFTSPGQTKSDKGADIWLQEMHAEFPELNPREDHRDGDGDKEAEFAMCTRTTAPFILIENEFHTNKKACKLLKSHEGQERFANVIVRTIERIEAEL